MILKQFQLHVWRKLEGVCASRGISTSGCESRLFFCVKKCRNFIVPSIKRTKFASASASAVSERLKPLTFKFCPAWWLSLDLNCVFFPATVTQFLPDFLNHFSAKKKPPKSKKQNKKKKTFRSAASPYVWLCPWGAESCNADAADGNIHSFNWLGS